MLRLVFAKCGAYEDKVAQILTSSLSAQHVQVIDKSGGCGESYEVIVRSTAFKGLSAIKQHRMVQDVIKDEIKKWHAVSIKTSFE